jgi:hypothetical protein
MGTTAITDGVNAADGIIGLNRDPEEEIMGV